MTVQCMRARTQPALLRSDWCSEHIISFVVQGVSGPGIAGTTDDNEKHQIDPVKPPAPVIFPTADLLFFQGGHIMLGRIIIFQLTSFTVFVILIAEYFRRY
ncbi:hypothetical protein L226DRAFT_565073 [Lentinus tigrinus ALCF2SS1-7]|uniref:uncharacterized protein n=1 Tax=Lentinus tigrinus ALCF2SS1-7 TaxID=1328758 RepID=UPI001165CD2D|nr:hypothetical protein L226DRAFT_565073 [Lentinus tigrinus ALCF2SS1-7]